jgi:hypothetical protein
MTNVAEAAFSRFQPPLMSGSIMNSLPEENKSDAASPGGMVDMEKVGSQVLSSNVSWTLVWEGLQRRHRELWPALNMRATADNLEWCVRSIMKSTVLSSEGYLSSECPLETGR